MSSVPPPPPPQPGKPKLRGRIPLRLALIFGVIGVALCVVGVVLIANSPIFRVDDFPTAELNRTQQVRISETGGVIVYFDAPSAGRQAFKVETFRLNDPSGRPVVLQTYENDLTYAVNGRSGVALFTFTARSTGTYTVQSRSSVAPPGSRLAFGESVVGGIVTGVLLFIPGLLFVIAAVVLLIVGLVKRSGHKRELASAYQGGPGPNYYTGQ